MAPGVIVPFSPKVIIRDVSHYFDGHQGRADALAPVSLEVSEGEFVCLVGPSGCGKTTLLNIIAGLISPSTGVVTSNGKAVTEPGPDRMMMFQESALFPWRTVMGNVQFGLEFHGELSRKQRSCRAEEMLELVGLSGFEDYAVHELSGGMKQRVALARALAPRPRVLLMDEPFGALDALTREQLYTDLQRIFQDEKVTTFFVTHNAREAACLADRVCVFSARPGSIIGTVTIPLPRPREINDAGVIEAARQISSLIRQLPPTNVHRPNIVADSVIGGGR